MLVHAKQASSGSAHVVVLGNEKGGSGKSTIALHIAVSLLKAGQRVATIDLDGRQRTFTHFIDNRRQWSRQTGLFLELPRHHCIVPGGSMQIADNESAEFAQFLTAVSELERTHDFIVVDTPGTDSYLTRLAHATADTLVTPLNDSFMDFDVLATIDPVAGIPVGESHYAELVRDARRKRRRIDGASTDWIVVRNRLSIHGSPDQQLLADGLKDLSFQLGFRSVDGLVEREVYREFFPRGLTVLDDLDHAPLSPLSDIDYLVARKEVAGVFSELKLPLDERGRRRIANRAEWFAQVDKPLQTSDVISI